MAKPPKQGDEYEVGYRKPPRRSRFKPGQSGNPHGRPRGKPRFEEVLRREAHKRIRVEVGGRPVEVTKIEATVKSLITSAIKGSMPAQRLLLKHLAAADLAEAAAAVASNTPEILPSFDEEQIRRMIQRFDHLREERDDE